MLDDLIHYWINDLPPAFDPTSPSLLFLSYYPIKIAAAESYTLVNALDFLIGGYELSLEGGWRSDLKRLESDLRFLSGWQRRCASLAVQIHSTREFIEHNKPANSEIWVEIALDYCYLAGRIDHFRELFKIMIPVVTSKIQIVEARSSFEETTNLSQLTYLALVFVPLTLSLTPDSPLQSNLDCPLRHTSLACDWMRGLAPIGLPSRLRTPPN
jgi:hypothetical protein